MILFFIFFNSFNKMILQVKRLVTKLTIEKYHLTEIVDFEPGSYPITTSKKYVSDNI